MSDCIIKGGEFINHPKEQGVYLKHFFCSADNDRLNNFEVKIDPGCQISPHTHESTSEFFYVVSGVGSYWDNGQWVPVQPGWALKAAAGQEHGLKNDGQEPFLLFSTFSPPAR